MISPGRCEARPAGVNDLNADARRVVERVTLVCITSAKLIYAEDLRVGDGPADRREWIPGLHRVGNPDDACRAAVRARDELTDAACGYELPNWASLPVWSWKSGRLFFGALSHTGLMHLFWTWILRRGWLCGWRLGSATETGETRELGRSGRSATTPWVEAWNGRAFGAAGGVWCDWRRRNRLSNLCWNG